MKSKPPESSARGCRALDSMTGPARTASLAKASETRCRRPARVQGLPKAAKFSLKDLTAHIIVVVYRCTTFVLSRSGESTAQQSHLAICESFHRSKVPAAHESCWRAQRTLVLHPTVYCLLVLQRRSFYHARARLEQPQPPAGADGACIGTSCTARAADPWSCSSRRVSRIGIVCVVEMHSHRGVNGAIGRASQQSQIWCCRSSLEKLHGHLAAPEFEASRRSVRSFREARCGGHRSNRGGRRQRVSDWRCC